MNLPFCCLFCWNFSHLCSAAINYPNMCLPLPFSALTPPIRSTNKKNVRWIPFWKQMNVLAVNVNPIWENSNIDQATWDIVVLFGSSLSHCCLYLIDLSKIFDLHEQDIVSFVICLALFCSFLFRAYVRTLWSTQSGALLCMCVHIVFWEQNSIADYHLNYCFQP